MESLICKRAFEFARRTACLCDALASRGFVAQRMARQLFDSASSVGANAEESQAAQTKADFAAKLSIARKESRENRYWLRLLVATGKASDAEVAWALKESGELIAMLTVAVRTAQATPNRGRRQPLSP